VFRKKTTVPTVILLLMPLALLCSACAKSTEPAQTNEPAPHVEPAVAPISQLLPPTPTPTPSLGIKSGAPPSATEVHDAVARVFDKAATADTTRPVAVGDFNGDGSEDLAVAVRPGEGALGDINNEMANWILEDPRNVPIPSLSTRIPPPKSVRAENGDRLLAIIHGVGAQGWRAPEAKQTFLLKTGGDKFLTQSFEDLRKISQPLPPLKGDVLNETLGGKSGFVFWTGAKYAWWVSRSN
jgi:hypothetical protein